MSRGADRRKIRPIYWLQILVKHRPGKTRGRKVEGGGKEASANLKSESTEHWCAHARSLEWWQPACSLCVQGNAAMQRVNYICLAMLTASFNPLSAIWRIYPSSKWSSQWPYDGYIRHGWMRSCGRGRGSATPECFGRGSEGTIFVRSSKLSLFFPELCSFRRVFLFPALL